MASVSCIIINYKNTEDTLDSLRSLEKLSGPENLQIIIVDNASSPQSRESLQEFNEVPFELIVQHDNLGFAGGINVAVREAVPADSDYIWLLNNDAMTAEDTLHQLVTAAEETNAAIVGGLICYYPEKDRIWCAQGKLHRPSYVVEHRGKGKQLDNYQLPSEPEAVSFVTGCCMLIRHKEYREVGGMDDSLFLYAEDVDLCEKNTARRTQARLSTKSKTMA